MGRVSQGRAFCVSLGVGLASLLVFLGAASASQRYYYKVTAVDYTAAAELTGAAAPDCVGTEIWSGKVSSEGQLAPADASLKPGVHFTVGAHGTRGAGYMHLNLHSNLYDATDRLTTACQDGGETAFALTPCTQALDGQLSVAVDISGGVGTRLKLAWNFLPHSMVPVEFRCAQRAFDFPDADKCTTRATLSGFNHKSVTLPFRCSSGTTVPPPRSGYVTFQADAYATGALHLKRAPWPYK
jgi:hypothetical protein